MLLIKFQKMSLMRGESRTSVLLVNCKQQQGPERYQYCNTAVEKKTKKNPLLQHHLTLSQSTLLIPLSLSPLLFPPPLCDFSSSAAAATTPTTGHPACTSPRRQQRAGWCPTAAVKPSSPAAERGTIRPTSTRWRSVNWPLSC